MAEHKITCSDCIYSGGDNWCNDTYWCNFNYSETATDDICSAFFDIEEAKEILEKRHT